MQEQLHKNLEDHFSWPVKVRSNVIKEHIVNEEQRGMQHKYNLIETTLLAEYYFELPIQKDYMSSLIYKYHDEYPFLFQSKIID